LMNSQKSDTVGNSEVYEFETYANCYLSLTTGGLRFFDGY
jgi:hypothetical protein